jgi:uncharacterized protein (TIGR02611 family)
MRWHSLRDLVRFILRSSKRIAVLVVGLVLVVGGLAMLVLPGPGIVVVILGLAVLATEFVWAERMLDRAKEQATKVKDRASRSLRRPGS